MKNLPSMGNQRHPLEGGIESATAQALCAPTTKGKGGLPPPSGLLKRIPLISDPSVYGQVELAPEILDAALVVSQNSLLKGMQSFAVLTAFFLVQMDIFACTTGTLDASGKGKGHVFHPPIRPECLRPVAPTRKIVQSSPKAHSPKLDIFHPAAGGLGRYLGARDWTGAKRKVI